MHINDGDDDNDDDDDNNNNLSFKMQKYIECENCNSCKNALSSAVTWD